jgi:hypothetical protein
MQENPYAAAIATRQKAEAEERAKAEASKPPPTPGSYEAQIAAMFAPDGGIAYKYRPEEASYEVPEVPELDCTARARAYYQAQEQQVQ